MAGNSGTGNTGKANHTSGRSAVGGVDATAAVGSAHSAQPTGVLAGDGRSKSALRGPSRDAVGDTGRVRFGGGVTRAGPGGVDTCLDSGSVDRPALDGEGEITGVQE